jgi:myo-inositol-1-phosphate synthase
MGREVPAAGVPIVGDNIKSQVDATITHRVLAKLLEDREVRLERTYQLNFGGNNGFPEHAGRIPAALEQDQQDPSRDLPDPHELRDADVGIGPSDYVPFLTDRKYALVRLEGRGSGDVPVHLEYKLEVRDSPNSAGIIIDAVRARKIAKDRGLRGPVMSACSYFMKISPVQYDDATARDLVEEFIKA